MTEASSLWNRTTSLFAASARRVETAVQECCARARLRAELNRVEQWGDLDLMLDDVGLPRWAPFQMLRNHTKAPGRLAGMLNRLGIIPTPKQQMSAEMREVQRTCLLCVSGRRCDHWLKRGHLGEERAFCPNAEAFDRLRGDIH
jgi:Family of unknown function (DUF6455)